MGTTMGLNEARIVPGASATARLPVGRRGGHRPLLQGKRALCDFRPIGTMVTPDGQFEPGRVGELKPPAAGKFERRFHNFSTRSLHPRLGVLKIGGKYHDHRIHFRGGVLTCKETAGEPSVGEAGVVGAVVGERPAKGSGIEIFHDGDVAGGKLDIVEAEVVFRRAHGRK